MAGTHARSILALDPKEPPAQGLAAVAHVLSRANSALSGPDPADMDIEGCCRGQQTVAKAAARNGPQTAISPTKANGPAEKGRGSAEGSSGAEAT